MKRKVLVIECDLCGMQQIAGDDTDNLGLTISRAFFAGITGGGPVSPRTFICIECLDGNDEHGPALMNVLINLVFDHEIDVSKAYAPKPKLKR